MSLTRHRYKPKKYIYVYIFIYKDKTKCSLNWASVTVFILWRVWWYWVVQEDGGVANSTRCRELCESEEDSKQYTKTGDGV